MSKDSPPLHIVKKIAELSGKIHKLPGYEEAMKEFTVTQNTEKLNKRLAEITSDPAYASIVAEANACYKDTEGLRSKFGIKMLGKEEALPTGYKRNSYSSRTVLHQQEKIDSKLNVEAKILIEGEEKHEDPYTLPLTSKLQMEALRDGILKDKDVQLILKVGAETRIYDGFCVLSKNILSILGTELIVEVESPSFFPPSMNPLEGKEAKNTSLKQEEGWEPFDLFGLLHGIAHMEHLKKISISLKNQKVPLTAASVCYALATYLEHYRDFQELRLEIQIEDPFTAPDITYFKDQGFQLEKKGEIYFVLKLS